MRRLRKTTMSELPRALPWRRGCWAGSGSALLWLLPRSSLPPCPSRRMHVHRLDRRSPAPAGSPAPPAPPWQVIRMSTGSEKWTTNSGFRLIAPEGGVVLHPLRPRQSGHTPSWVAQGAVCCLCWKLITSCSYDDLLCAESKQDSFYSTYQENCFSDGMASVLLP